VIEVGPVAGLSNYGQKPMRCRRAQPPVPFSDASRTAKEAVTNAPNAILPGQIDHRIVPEMSPEKTERREHLLNVLEKASRRIRENLT
jgi:hypothetical protein